jgi:hypothetical protein
MKSDYNDLIRHIPLLEDHGNLYMYYGVPYSEECVVYGEDEEDSNLILSYECEDLCNAIAEKFQYEFKWHDVLRSRKISLEKVFDIDVEAQDFDVIASLLLYLVVSVTFEDKFIDALNNGYLIRLLKRLEYLTER